MGCTAVVVTFNRLKLLRETVRALREQTAPIQKIIVVNNSSTDGTAEWLEEQQDLVVLTQENLGGAGGFKTGMKRAYEDGAEWIWVMDDDVFPTANALERLLAWRDCSGCMVPARVYSDDKPCDWGYIFDLRKRSIVFGTRPSEQDAIKAVTVVTTACFEGMLVHRNLVEKVGLPDPRFFISGDDTTYGLRLSRYANILYVRDALLVRAKTSEESRKLSPMFVYYYFRNFHLIEECYRDLSGGEHYGLLWHGKYFAGALLVLRRCWIDSRSSFLAVAGAIARGMRDSYLKKVGKTF